MFSNKTVTFQVQVINLSIDRVVAKNSLVGQFSITVKQCLDSIGESGVNRLYKSGYSGSNAVQVVFESLFVVLHFRQSKR